MGARKKVSSSSSFLSSSDSSLAFISSMAGMLHSFTMRVRVETRLDLFTFEMFLISLEFCSWMISSRASFLVLDCAIATHGG